MNTMTLALVLLAFALICTGMNLSYVKLPECSLKIWRTPSVEAAMLKAERLDDKRLLNTLGAVKDRTVEQHVAFRAAMARLVQSDDERLTALMEKTRALTESESPQV